MLAIYIYIYIWPFNCVIFESGIIFLFSRVEITTGLMFALWHHSEEKALQIKTRDWAKVSLEGAEAKAECLISGVKHTCSKA